MKKHIIYLIVLLIIGCDSNLKKWMTYDEKQEIEENSNSKIKKLQYKRIQSISTDKNELIKGYENEINLFLKSKYDKLEPLIIEKSIPEIQQHIIDGKFTYYDLSLFYITRIYLIEFNKETFLNSVISLNKNVLNDAMEKDKLGNEDIYSIFGIPILLKDNIGFESLPTTAGAYSLKDNYTEDAFITKKLKSEGAIILGKTNLSEWANYFCSGCPNGYTSLGGQTLNPYGRKIIDTGGSSSGSGVATASNLSSVSLGSETSGSILSPSSANSLVGMKPTIGNISRSGIIPISSTLDTAGPMTRSIIDNIIVYNAINGYDSEDIYSKESRDIDIEKVLNFDSSKVRLGYFKNFYENDSLYKKAVDHIKENNITAIEIKSPRVNLSNFVKILDEDMRKDLKSYLSIYGNEKLEVSDISSIIEFNDKDSIVRAPYGQGIFKKIINDTMNKEEFDKLKIRLMNEGNKFFDIPMDKYDLDVVISLNNYHAGYAAVAHNPCLTIPIGLRKSNEPAGITFIGKSFSEQLLYEIGLYFEESYEGRVPPKNSN
tara:strand:+ start:2001 stop:3632 length:1632 start_codon:yes stop_codon:yes gene_type:complete